jgi:hypothetical protein
LKQISPLLVLWQNLGAGSGHAPIYHSGEWRKKAELTIRSNRVL